MIHMHLALFLCSKRNLIVLAGQFVLKIVEIVEICWSISIGQADIQALLDISGGQMHAHFLLHKHLRLYIYATKPLDR